MKMMDTNNKFTAATLVKITMMTQLRNSRAGVMATATQCSGIRNSCFTLHVMTEMKWQLGEAKF